MSAKLDPTAPNIKKITALWPSEWREDFEERAAIVQYCGGVSQERAEALAYEIVMQRRKVTR